MNILRQDKRTSKTKDASNTNFSETSSCPDEPNFLAVSVAGSYHAKVGPEPSLMGGGVRGSLAAGVVGAANGAAGGVSVAAVDGAADVSEVILR